MTDEAHFGQRFGTVAILGVGLIGGSLGMALRARRLARRVIGIGRDRSRLETAIQLGAIDEATTDWRAGVGEAEIVVLGTTIGHILEMLPDVLASVQPGTLVTDVGSTKSAIVASAGGAARFVGGHPMAGSEKGGVEAAMPTLFQEATWALTPIANTDPAALRQAQMLAQEVGATTRVFTPEAHDAMVAITSHLPHVLASALMRLASDTQTHYPETSSLAAGSFADMTRVSASSPDLWRDVCLSNRDAVLHALAGYRAELDVLEAAVAAQDANAIESFFAQGAAAKRDWRRL
jgi:prephenate dehydrogenase